MAEQKTTAKKKSTTTKTKTNKQEQNKIEKVVETKTTEKIDDNVAKMFKEMQDKINALTKQLEQAQNKNENNNIVVATNADVNRTVKIISMLPNTYVLKSDKGRGCVLRHFGDSKNIKYSDAIEIVEKYESQFEKGWAILGSKKDYEDLGLISVYDSIIDQEKMERFIRLESDDIVDTILDMDEDTIDRIANIIAHRLADGAKYDYNRLQRFVDDGYDIYSIKELISVKE